ncbi:hypothetical protein ACKS0A_09222 [Histoplasma ohiense]
MPRCVPQQTPILRRSPQRDIHSEPSVTRTTNRGLSELSGVSVRGCQLCASGGGNRRRGPRTGRRSGFGRGSKS